MPLGVTFLSALFVRASDENEGRVVSTGQAFLLHTQIRAFNTFNVLFLRRLILSSDMLPMRTQNWPYLQDGRVQASLSLAFGTVL